MSALARTAHPTPQITRKKRRSGSPWAHGGDNGRTVLVCCPAAATIATTDPFDRAHLRGNFDTIDKPARREAGPDGRPKSTQFMFYPSAITRPDGTVGVNRMFTSTPRRYPRSAMTSRGVAHDSMFDDWHDARTRLIREGIALGGGGHCTSAHAAAFDNRLRENIRIRDILEQTMTPEAGTPEEERIELRANKILERAGFFKPKEDTRP